ARAVSRELFCPFPLHDMQVSIAGFVYCVQIVFEQRLPRAASIDQSWAIISSPIVHYCVQ
ncbi:MAG: hypothetical protein II140_05700, partial [Paludibacteraceae bacterium]|nr:hypothetical protein [Paludibacteraceae bacterium]